MFKKSLLLFCLFYFVTGVQARTCPEGGQPGIVDPKYCCKGPYIESSYAGIDGKMHTVYAEFQPGICGCPDGGSLSQDHRTCCKNGYTYGGYYVSLSDDIINNRIPNPDVKKGSYVYLNAESCGCPEGLEEKNGVCCDNGWVGNDYNPWKCGCPDGGTMNQEARVCLKRGYGYNPHIKKYVNVWPYEYGCPDESILVKGFSKLMDICCKGNFTYDDDKYNWTKADSRCGCPDGGKASVNAGKGYPSVYPCCKDGFMYNSETGKYDKKNDYYCRPETYQMPKEEINKYKNDPEAFFKYWQQNQDQFKKKAQEKKSESPYAYKRNQK